MPFRAVAATAALLCLAAPAAAALTYRFSLPGTDQAFRWTTTDFVRLPTTVPVGDLDYCRSDPGTTCGDPFFGDEIGFTLGEPPPPQDVILFVTRYSSDIIGFRPSYFVDGAFTAFGTYQARNNNGTLVVSAAVPEPASWALLVAGFGLTGAILRRRAVAVAA